MTYSTTGAAIAVSINPLRRGRLKKHWAAFVLALSPLSLLAGCAEPPPPQITAPGLALTEEQRSGGITTSSAPADPAAALILFAAGLVVEGIVRAGITEAAQTSAGDERQNRFLSLESRAKDGDASAQVDLATMYRTCYGAGRCKRDYDTALKWSLRAAEQGYPDGMLSVGYTLANCPIKRESTTDVEGTCTRDLPKAAEWFHKAADHGSAEAQWLLGILYSGKRFVAGGPTGEKELSDSPEAKSVWGLRRDLARSNDWFQKSAEQEFGLSQYVLGWRYSRGVDVSKNYNFAMHWYRKAAEKGHLLAIYRLGELYEEGKGTPRDYAEAYYWYHLSSCGGFEYFDASSKLSELRQRKLGWADVEFQEKRADEKCEALKSIEWQPKHRFR